MGQKEKITSEYEKNLVRILDNLTECEEEEQDTILDEYLYRFLVRMEKITQNKMPGYIGAAMALFLQLFVSVIIGILITMRVNKIKKRKQTAKTVIWGGICGIKLCILFELLWMNLTAGYIVG